MTQPIQGLSDAQTEFLRHSIAVDNGEVSGALEMLTGHAVELQSLQINVIPQGDLITLMDFSPGPVLQVSSEFRGNIEGELLFLQSNSDFQALGNVMKPVLTGASRHGANEATNQTLPNWLVEKREMNEKLLQANVLDAMSEFGNVLFGIHMTALHNSCKLTVYQGIPDAKLMHIQDSRLGSLRPGTRSIDLTNIAIVTEIEYVIERTRLKAWLVMLPLKKGVCTMLDCMDAIGVSKSPSRPNPIQENKFGLEQQEIRRGFYKISNHPGRN